MVLLACKGKEPPAPAPSPEVPPEPTPTPTVQPDFPEWTRSLELVRTVGVRLEPGDDGKRIGTIAVDTRVAWNRTQNGKGCDKPWIEIEPKGWICGDYVKPSKQPPYGQEVPHLERGEIVPGTYGKVTGAGAVTYTLDKPKKGKKGSKDPAEPKLVEDQPILGSLNVREWDEVTFAGKVYWKISQKDPEYVLKSSVSRHVPSNWGGTRLGDDIGWAVPIAFVWPRGGMVTAYTYAKPTGGMLRELPARAPVPVLETATDKPGGKIIAYRIGEGEWMNAADVHVFTPMPLPPLLQPNER